MEWKEVRLGDIVSIKSGLAYKGAFIGKGENILLGMGCVSFKDKFLFSGARPYEADCDDKYCVEPGDIVLATRQQSDKLPILAMPALIPSSLKAKKIIYGTNLYKVENHSEVTNDFLFWQLKTPDYIDYISSVKTGSVVRMVTKKNVEDYVFRCPPKEVRDRISKLLWGLDRKIELNNKINADLEEMAQAIFKNWFVDFEPFKDGKFMDSELGMIPEGWKVGTLKDLLYLRKDSIKAANKGNLPYLPIDTIPMHCLVATDFKSNDEAKSSLQTFEQNDIVVGAMRVYFHRVILAPCKGITRTTCFVLSVKNENALVYSLMQCNQDEAISFAEKTSKGSTMPYAVWDGGYGEYKVVIPPSEVMKSFNDLLSNFFSKMNKNAIENSRLSLLRDTLLPRLMSGELEVPE